MFMFLTVQVGIAPDGGCMNEIIHIPVGPDFLCWSRPIYAAMHCQKNSPVSHILLNFYK